MRGVVGQDDAVEALRFDSIHAPGQNVYVRGLSGTDARTVRHLEQVQPACSLPPDRCYVHDFEQPDRPALVTLPRGRGRAFGSRVDELVAYLRDQLVPALESDAMKARGAVRSRRSSRTSSRRSPHPRTGAPSARTSAGHGRRRRHAASVDPAPSSTAKLARRTALAALVQEKKLGEAEMRALAEKIEHYAARHDELGARARN
ncbi:MAG: Lon-like protease helical domain-containing protein [Planctomycetota bacterium]